MHVEPSISSEETDWSAFPGLRSTLARWGVLPEGIEAEEVGEALGLTVRKIVKEGRDPVGALLEHVRTFAPDLIVLSTHQRDGVDRWLHRSVAEPLARRSGAMTLFVPREGRGFVSPQDGAVGLSRVLIPVDHAPPADTAIHRTWELLRRLGCTGCAVRLLYVGEPAQAPSPGGPESAEWSRELVVRQGDVVPRILEEEAQWGADLLVLATEGHQDFLDAFRGSTTERVVRGARCPVLAVPERAETHA